MLNYAEKYEPQLLEIVMDGAYTSPFITSNVKWLNARTFNFTQMSTTGFKDHSRSGGWNKGTIDQTNKDFTVQHDRDVQFLVDKADVDETARTAAVENISKTFVMTQQVPETDAVFFSKVAAASKGDYLKSRSIDDYAPTKVLAQLKADIALVKRYKNKGLIVYVVGEIMDNLSLAPEFTRVIEVTSISESGAGIQTRITMLDGTPIMEVIDEDRFHTAFDFDGANGGFTPATSSSEILVQGATPLTTKTVPKIASIYYFNAGQHTEGDGDLYQNRALWDTFTFPNGKDGNVDSVFTITKAAAELPQG